MATGSRIPDRLLDIIRTAESDASARFPPTEVFNEGWMLRLVLDAFQTLKIKSHPLAFEAGTEWYSEARLESPFRPRRRPDDLAEGSTNADGVIAKFQFRTSTRAGLQLSADASQFVVLEAKMFSNLSAGTKNAPTYDQAARNVACMAEAIARSGRSLQEFSSLGFFVLAPGLERRGRGVSNLETAMEPHSIKAAIRQRIAAYEVAGRPEATDLASWEAAHLAPFVDWLVASGRLAVVSWEDCIGTVREADAEMGEQLLMFYQRCLEFAPKVAADRTSDGELS